MGTSPEAARARRVLVDQEKPASRHVVEQLPPVQRAAWRARRVVTEACVRWNLAHLVSSATVIMSELVSNVVDHAHTIMTIEIAVRGPFLYLAVHDGGGAPPAAREHNGASDARGRGLHLVAAFSNDWGYITHEQGKTVWATLALTTP